MGPNQVCPHRAIVCDLSKKRVRDYTFLGRWKERPRDC
jgi:hypothetical protein